MFGDCEWAQSDLLDLKEDLDNSIKKNGFFRAIHALSKFPNPINKDVVAVANLHAVDGDDVFFLYHALEASDIVGISDFILSDESYSEEEVLQIINSTTRIARTLVYRKLGFILTHDQMFESADDLMGHLHIAIMRAIREYEIFYATPAHMNSRVRKSLKHQVINIAERHGREKRQAVMRVRETRSTRVLYYLDVSTASVKSIIAYPDRSLRKKKNGSIVIAVKDALTLEWMVVHYKRIYETEDEAFQALEMYQQGVYSKRNRFVDPSPQDIDDFQLNILSIDVMDARENSRPFADVCMDSKELPARMEYSTRREDLLNNLGPRGREFAEIVLDSAIDDLFDAWCEEHGYNVTTFDLSKLGRVACKYLNLSKTQLQSELNKTNSSLWEDHQLDLIASHARSVGAQADDEN